MVWVLFSLPHRDIAPLGKVAITGTLCSLCECGGGGVGYGASPILLGTHVPQYQALPASPACRLQGWLEQPWSNLLCFLTPVKLYSEVCLCIYVSALHAKQNFLPPETLPLKPHLCRLPPHPYPPLSFITEEAGGGRGQGRIWGVVTWWGEGGWSGRIQQEFFGFYSLKWWHINMCKSLALLWRRFCLCGNLRMACTLLVGNACLEMCGLALS